MCGPSDKALESPARRAMPKVSNLDFGARLVLAVAVGAAIYLIAAPLAMLLLSAFRGPADYLPFEPGARWTLEHLYALVTDPVIYTRVLPDTFTFVAGTVTLVFVIAFALARGCHALLRGIRDGADLGYERGMASINRDAGGIDTLFMVPAPAVAHLSSALVRTALTAGLGFEALVPAVVAAGLRRT